jgi:hypothetical protein
MKSMILAAATIVALSFNAANAGEGGPNYDSAKASRSYAAESAPVQNHAAATWTQRSTDGGFGNG